MYESPIEIIEGVTNHVMREAEDGIVCEIRNQLGVVVDKEELTKALQYDRHQYERGYADGKNSALKWIPVSERLPEETGVYLCTVYCGRCGYRVFECSFYNAMSGWSNEDVVAWMPLPEPYKEGEDSCFT